jgi:exonuclease III
MYLYFFLTLLVNKTVGETECPTVINIGEDRRSNKNSLRLVQYNVEWLFIDYYSPMNCPGSGCSWHNSDEAITHMDYVADVINKLNPDLINFCEVEGCDELNILLTKLKNNSSYKSYLKKGTDTATGQNVGLITKIDPLVNLYRSEEKVDYPIANSKCGETNISGLEGVSKHYITEYNLFNMNIALIGIHLLAIPKDTDRCTQREAQAQVIQNIVYNYIANDYEIIVIGDLNDYDGKVLDINNNQPNSRVLDFIKGLDGEKKNLYLLTNVAVNIEQQERYSDWWDSDNNCSTNLVEDYSMIDHVLVTNKIFKYIKNVFIYHGYKEYCGKFDSDHYPVIIDFLYN